MESQVLWEVKKDGRDKVMGIDARKMYMDGEGVVREGDTLKLRGNKERIKG